MVERNENFSELNISDEIENELSGQQLSTQFNI